MLNKKIDPVLVLKEQIIWWGRLLINLLQTKVKVKLSLRPQRGTALTKRAIYLKKERERGCDSGGHGAGLMKGL